MQIECKLPKQLHPTSQTWLFGSKVKKKSEFA